MAEAGTTTRRERLREEATRDLVEAALDQLREVGAEALSLRAVAREVGMSPAGVYRYFDGRDELLTALIAQGFDDLADHLFAATGADEDVIGGHGRPAPPIAERIDPLDRPGAALAAVCRAYRGWALGRPNEFGLLYGDPVRGYAAPVDGVTTIANSRVARAMIAPVVAAHLAGRLDVGPAYRGLDDDPGGRRLAADVERVTGEALPGGVALRAIGAWARLHGVVSMEVFNQLTWLYPDGAEALFEAELTTHLRDLGLEP